MDQIELVKNVHSRQSCDFASLTMEQAKAVQKFHSSFPVYETTPLASLDSLAKTAGVSNIWLKDESFRFGLNAFKVLGGSYAIGRCLAERWGLNVDAMTYEQLKEARGARKMTFVSATDGNHGRGVAWAARMLGHDSVIYMPKGSAQERFDNIAAEGAHVEITDLNYDDAVRKADRDGKENGWMLVQDTAWDGYEDIPLWIMQGYTTLALEILAQLEQQKPTHIFVQAGVGSFAGAALGFFANLYLGQKPVMAVVEPHEANCLYLTAKADDGKRHFVTGDMQTIMAGLACGEPNTISWDILKDCTDFFLSSPEYVAAKGMRILSAPLEQDRRVVAGESGAAAFGTVMEILMNPEYSQMKQTLGIDENSRLLFISSEGDTDQENYRRIVWDGAWSSGK